ncbi:DNA-3-methyladenine glycosylase [soil metagenome]
MPSRLPTTQPFSFEQTLTFIRRFPPCQGEYLLGEDAVTAAVSIGARAVPTTIRRRGAGLEVATPRAADGTAVAAHAAHWIGAQDDVSELYAAARGDAPFLRLIEKLHGLHHVRFLTLAEISVYCVMMQRTPITMASRMKRAFLDRFGTPVEIEGRTLRAMPELAQLVELDGDEIGTAIRHARKGTMIANVVRGVAVIGEQTLREAPYAEARDALLAINGIGPFSAAAILLRGLGRMDEVPSVRMFADDAAVVYGGAIDEAAIARRYGRQIGYWSFYVKTGASRLRE